MLIISDPQNGSRWQVFQDVLSPDQENLDLANVNLMLELLVQKKKQLEAVSKVSSGTRHLFHVFLCQLFLEFCNCIWLLRVTESWTMFYGVKENNNSDYLRHRWLLIPCQRRKIQSPPGALKIHTDSLGWTVHVRGHMIMTDWYF